MLDYSNITLSETMSNTNTSEEIEELGKTRSASRKSITKVTNVLAPKDVVMLEHLKHDNIVKCENYLNAVQGTQETLPLDTWMPASIQFIIGPKLKSCDIPEWADWKTKDYRQWLIPTLKQVYPLDNRTHSSATMSQRVKELLVPFLKLNIFKEETMHIFIKKYREIFQLEKVGNIDAAEATMLLEKLYEQMVPKDNVNEKKNPVAAYLKDILKEQIKPKTLESWLDEFMALYYKHQKSTIETLQLLGVEQTTVEQHWKKSVDGNKQQGTKRHAPDNNTVSAPAAGASKVSSSYSACNGCGKLHKGECSLRKHPDWNTENVPFENSTNGKAFSEKLKKPVTSLPWTLTLSGKPWDHPPKPDKPFKRSKCEHECTNCSGDMEMLNLITNNNDIHTLPVLLQADVTKQCTQDLFPARALVDTGALHGNYINIATANILKNSGAIVDKSTHRVCNVFGTCSDNVGSVMINLIPINEKMCYETVSKQTNCTDCSERTILKIKCTIIDTPYDIIIGRPTIREHNLLERFKEHLMCIPCAHESRADQGTHPAASQLAATYHANIHAENKYKRESMRTYLDYDSEDEDIELSTSVDDPYHPDREEIEGEIPTEIYGSEKLQKDITELCNQYVDIFSTKLRPQPADIPAYEIKCDTEKWHVNKNRQPARVQTHAKQEETIRQINDMLKNNVIRKSQASTYSQVLLTPKPNNKWRFCVDYRNLNAACDKQGWPIPNIKLMIDRIGHRVPKSKIFGKIDLTSGYYQAPLSLSSTILTAFITLIGVFEWLRVPMGLCGAPPYFQQVMATVVLVGLLHATCELYIDDVFVHAATEEEFIIRLRAIFERFRKHKITVNPQKCILGKEEIEFVGHLITAEGITYTRERLDDVLQIPLPTHERGLKKFLGVVNYFHDHIRDHSTIVRPLQKLVHNYNPTRKIVWTPEATQAFERIKIAINQCPVLSFLDANAPVYLHTDASDYGIGSYLFQIIDGKEIPIAFMSKALSERESRWSTPEKECYAIYYSLVKFEHLLRDIYFVIRTDHKNLTYMNESANAKVNRWKMKIQHFTFDIEYIPGEENIVADGFSRLLTVAGTDLETAEKINIIDEFKLDKDIYKKISAVHNSRSGHFGVERTLMKLQQQHEEWPFMRQHIKKFIQQCPCCQKMSVLKIPIHTHPYTTAASAPMERLSVDTIGPFDPDEDGKTYIIAIIDNFTRWLELYTSKDASALSAAQALLEHVGRYGAPHQILSDNGSQYVNSVIKELTGMIGTEHVKTLAYSHEENAIVERSHKETLRHLRAMLFDENTVHKWSKCISFVQRIENASYNSSIGTSPAALLFGNSINLDRGIFLPLGEHSEWNNIGLYSSELLAAQQNILKVAQKLQSEKDQFHIQNGSAIQTEFNDGTYVLVEYPHGNIHKGPPNKLNTYLKGPMRVIRHRGAQYTLANLVTSKNETVHITRLRPFIYDEYNINPIDIANKDSFATIVDKIVAHSPVVPSYSNVKRSELEFKVRWKGLDESEDRYLPYKELRNNPALHIYLRERNMSKYIPPEHKN